MTTAPEPCAARALGGYVGLAPEIFRPEITPLDTRAGPLGGAILTTGAGAAPIPPITPPGTPVPLPMPLIPATPAVVGGADSSFSILMSLGIFVGACRPSSISETILIGFTICCGGGGGAGGGGGGGRDIIAVSAVCGSASGYSSGIRIMVARIAPVKANVANIQYVDVVLIWPPDSINEDSNICSLFR